MPEERRRDGRMQMNLPVRVKVSNGETIDLELVDIGPTGLKMRGDTLSIFGSEQTPDASDIRFEVRVSGRLAYVEPEDDGSLAIGLDLSREQMGSTRDGRVE